MTKMSDINYADNGTVCKTMKCPNNQTKLERTCINGTWTGQGAWCGQKDMKKPGSCPINSTIQCYDKMENMTKMSDINYADNGTVCKTMKCPNNQTKLERTCINGTWTGQGAWCGQKVAL